MPSESQFEIEVMLEKVYGCQRENLWVSRRIIHMTELAGFPNRKRDVEDSICEFLKIAYGAEAIAESLASDIVDYLC